MLPAQSMKILGPGKEAQNHGMNLVELLFVMAVPFAGAFIDDG